MHDPRNRLKAEKIANPANSHPSRLKLRIMVHRRADRLEDTDCLDVEGHQGGDRESADETFYAAEGNCTMSSAISRE
jgi:hypothetical protein